MVLNGPELTLVCWGLSPVTVLATSTAETIKTVATMVMLTGPDSGSWQYWPADDGDRTATYGCMTVTLVNRESRPSYVKREFTVCNTKVGPNPKILKTKNGSILYPR